MSTDVTIDEFGRPHPPLAADEATALFAFLDYQRATLRWKCSGVDAAAMRTRVARSDLTLGGLLKHMSLVEDGWFRRRLFGGHMRKPFADADWDTDPDWEIHSADHDSPEDLLNLWDGAVNQSRENAARAMADGGLDRLSDVTWADGRTPNLRWIVLHMIEEYARHVGHADLIREVVDGSTGE